MKDAEYYNLSQQVSRSTIAILDAMFQRGAIKGEEAQTVGNLRMQCAQLSNETEERQNNLNSEAEGS